MIEDLKALPPFSQLWQRLDSFPRQQRRFAEMVLHSPDFVVFGSIRDVSKRAGVNNATIMRVVSALGFEGYREFQTALRLAYLQRAGISQIATNSGAALRSPSVAVDFARTQQIANLDAAYESFRAANIDRIADLLIGAGHIVIYAEGAAASIGTILNKYLSQLHIRSELKLGEVDAAIALRSLGSRDVAVLLANAITFSPTVRLCDYARSRGIATIAIVGNPISPLAGRADETLVAPAQSPTLLYSLTAVVSVLELLASHIAGRRATDVPHERKQLFDMYLDQALIASLDGAPEDDPENEMS